MSRFTGLWLAAVLMLNLCAVSVNTGPGVRSGSVRLPGEIMSRKAGQAFCPSVPLVHRSLIIPAKRCYLIAVMHDSRGMFLAFTPVGTQITPGHRLRLDTPAGPQLKARLLLVPIHSYGILAPLDTLGLVAAEIQDSGMQFSIKLVDTPVPNLIVTFDVHV